MPEDLNKTQQDMRPPRLSWYEQRRTPVADDKSTTITLNWAKVGPMIGLTVFIGGLVTTSVNAAVSVAQYKAQLEAHDHKLQEQQERIQELQERVTRLSTVQDMLERLQGRMAELESSAQDMPTTPASAVQIMRPRNRPYAASAVSAGVP